MLIRIKKCWCGSTNQRDECGMLKNHNFEGGAVTENGKVSDKTMGVGGLIGAARKGMGSDKVRGLRPGC